LTGAIVKCLTRFGWSFAFACLISSSGAHAGYSSLFIFGDSLSDSGNNAIVLAPNVTPVPISGNTFIPTYPYASGHYTNNQVWAQSFAAAFGLSALPSLAGGTDYAFGGATTGPISNDLFNPFPASLLTQAAFFLAQHANMAPSSALYVVAGGGNNARAALDAIGACLNPACVAGVIQSTAVAFATDEATIVGELEGAGARHIVVWDAPDVGLAPAILASGPSASAIGTLLASSMNAALMNVIGADPDVKLFDLFGLQDAFVANPADFGLTNVKDACAQFVNCNPANYLFWDGIHPTSAGHQLISDAMVALVPEPATVALLGLGLAGLGFSRRKQ
jgi:outer membrane lipase/esterase